MKKRIYIILIVLSLLLSLGCEKKEKETQNDVITNEVQNNKNNKEETIKKEEIKVNKEDVITSYKSVLKSYDCHTDLYITTCFYYITDINKDKIPEIIVKTGEEENSVVDFYTYNKGSKKIGTLSYGNSILYGTDEKYIIKQYTKDEYEEIYHLEIINGELKEILIEDNDYTNKDDFEYKIFDKDLLPFQIDDYESLEVYY